MSRLSVVAVLLLVASPVLAGKVKEVRQLTVTKPDGSTTLAKIYRIEHPASLLTFMDGDDFWLSIDGMSETVRSGGFEHTMGPLYQSPDKREFVQMTGFRGLPGRGTVFDLVSYTTSQLPEPTRIEVLDKEDYVQLRWHTKLEAVSTPDLYTKLVADGGREADDAIEEIKCRDFADADWPLAAAVLFDAKADPVVRSRVIYLPFDDVGLREKDRRLLAEVNGLNPDRRLIAAWHAGQHLDDDFKELDDFDLARVHAGPAAERERHIDTARTILNKRIAAADERTAATKPARPRPATARVP